VLQQLGQMTNANDPERGIVRGLALNPGTPVEAVEPLLDELELILVLAVNPGWGGQRFIPGTMDRLAHAREIAAGTSRPILVGVDGGITRQNAGEVARGGADLIVTGSAVFDGKAAAENARAMLLAVHSD
jgi:ribulose-phosphate 3-epimerase